MAYTTGRQRKVYIAAPIAEPVTLAGALAAITSDDLVCQVQTWTLNQSAAPVEWDDNCGHQIAAGVISRSFDATLTLDESKEWYSILQTAFDNGTKVFVALCNGLIGDTGTIGVAGNVSVLDLTQPASTNSQTNITIKLGFMSQDFVRIG